MLSAYLNALREGAVVGGEFKIFELEKKKSSRYLHKAELVSIRLAL